VAAASPKPVLILNNLRRGGPRLQAATPLAGAFAECSAAFRRALSGTLRHKGQVCVRRPFLFSSIPPASDGSINNGSTKETTISIEITITITITIEMTMPLMNLIEFSMIENSMILMMDSSASLSEISLPIETTTIP
jgi:hypothetical protein